MARGLRDTNIAYGFEGFHRDGFRAETRLSLLLILLAGFLWLAARHDVPHQHGDGGPDEKARYDNEDEQPR